VPADQPLSEAEVREIRRIGENTNCMTLKGATPDHTGPARPDSWPVDGELAQIAGRWGIDPARDLALAH